MNKFIFFILSIHNCFVLNAQSILIDESFDDWAEVELKIIDSGDSNNIDFQLLQVSNDENYIYFRLKLNRNINLQNDNSIKLAIDTDDNINTGTMIYNIGADFIYEFGRRVGAINGNSTIFHNDIGLMSLPTVTSDDFEIAISRNIRNGAIYLEGNIKFYIYTSLSSGDVIPNQNENNNFIFDEAINSNYPVVDLEKRNSSDIRIMSYNVLRDNIFSNSLNNEYTRILRSINADIMCFQEIYDHSAEQLLTLLESSNIIPANELWYAVKDGRDLITVSRYPIIYHQEVDGNSAVELLTNNGPMLILNCHLPCCENDSDRVSEIDALLSFLSMSLEGETDIQLAEGTPYIILGDMNFVGDASQVNSLITGDIISNFIYGPDVRMDYGDGALTDSKPITTGFPASFTWFNDESSFPSGRLDYLLYTDSALQKSNSFVLNTKGLNSTELIEYNLQESDTERASDHLPVIVDFENDTSSSTGQYFADSDIWFPNPTHSLFKLKTDDEVKVVSIYNQAGQKQNLVSNQHEGSFQIDFSSSLSGVYFLIYQQRGITKATKVVVK